MTMVEYPAMRREVVRALAAFADRGYQHRVCELRQYPGDNFYDDLTQNVHVVYDDCQVLPDPLRRLGSVLVPGDEVDRLRALDSVLGPLIDDLGGVPDSAYVRDPRWSAVMSAAAAALTSMVLAGVIRGERRAVVGIPGAAVQIVAVAAAGVRRDGTMLTATPGFWFALECPSGRHSGRVGDRDGRARRHVHRHRVRRRRRQQRRGHPDQRRPG
jgi:hypothetical protein